ncbi:MAG TPA: acetate--CoA ligase [Mycobacteriales bacterium]|jgi:acetyl-CoA synthetase|nr:acetate--CoA ligase [Mycobacteriales bacterium]
MGTPLSNLLSEPRLFDPPAGLVAHANVTAEAYDNAERNYIEFWEQQAHRLSWTEEWHTPLDWQPPFAQWFAGGRLNVAYNCVDRHVESGHGDQAAIIWEGEPGDRRVLSYAELKDQVCRAANALTALGVAAGDRVMIYLPMIPEAIISMLACARIGAVHSVVFGGFSASSLRSRSQDTGAKLLITADGGYRRGATHGLKVIADEAIPGTDIAKVLVVRRTGQDIGWQGGRDVWWHDLVDSQAAEHICQAFDAEHPLFILYTSGTTAKPKGILHTSGGYLTQVSYTHHAVFDHKPDVDVYWCAADVGWITGHSYIVYGPLSNRATQVMYEGTPDTPHTGRFWEIIQTHRVSILYTAPTTIRTFMRWGDQIPAGYDLSSLRLLGSVGEPINPEAWMWYRENIGHGRCPIVDTWWQTETGAIMISPLPGVTRMKPGSAQRAVPGINLDVVDDRGSAVANGESGYLALTKPWPAMLRGIWGDPQRYVDTYWSRYADAGYYFAGDGAKKDEDGDIWLLGRVDDVMNVSGHRISTTEVESALVSHPLVAEAAVVGANDPTTGQAIVAFVIPRGNCAEEPSELSLLLRAHVAIRIGAIAKPRRIVVVPELPKTRSGKIMRRLLQDLANDRELGDMTTLADGTVMDLIRMNLRQPAIADRELLTNVAP